MSKTKQCGRCGITVDVDKIGLKDRCTDPRCPLNDLKDVQKKDNRR